MEITEERMISLVKDSVKKALKEYKNLNENQKEAYRWFWVFTSTTESLPGINGGIVFHKHYALNASYAIDNDDAEMIIYEVLDNDWEIEGSLICDREDNLWLNERWNNDKEKYNLGELKPNEFLDYIDEVNDQDEWSYEVPDLNVNEIASLFGL